MAVEIKVDKNNLGKLTQAPPKSARTVNGASLYFPRLP
jgi:hypothetical protein